jgi:hypothetical protein
LNIVKEINADSLFPIHTVHPKAYMKSIKNVKVPAEGETYFL